MSARCKPYVVGIVGGSASGKTSFLRDLLARLPDGSATVMAQDNYYKSLNEQQRDAQGHPNFDLPDAIHLDRFQEDLGAMIRSEVVERREYTYNFRAQPGRLITMVPADLLLVDGLFLFHYESIRRMFDLRIFIDASEEVCKQRRLERDCKERGYYCEHVEYQWTNHVLPAYRKFILPYREEAHLIITNHGSYEKGLEVVVDHVRSRLRPGNG